MLEYEVYSYEAFRKKIRDELRVAERAGLSDIDTDAHTQYLITMRKKKPNLADLPTEKIDSLQGFTTDGRPTLAGVMMFSPYPQGFFPQLCVTAVCVQGTEMGSDNAVGERFIDNARIDGNIVKFQRQAVDKLPDGAHHSPACRAGENKARHSRQTPQQKSEILQLN